MFGQGKLASAAPPGPPRWTPALGAAMPCAVLLKPRRRLSVSPVLDKIFSWWSGATIGTLFTLAKSADRVGEDEFGNVYYEARTNRGSYDARRRRYVTYKGYAEPTKIPPEWHAWVHYLTEEPPTVAPLRRRPWEKEHLPNLTGTAYAWRPKGSIARGGERPRAIGDYQAWTPGE